VIKMKIAAMLGLLTMLCVSPAFAKGETVKIVIEGGDLKAPIETTDRAVMTKFNVWSGMSTYSDDGPGFIVDWAKGVVADPPAGLPRYQVSFYAKLNTDRLAYVVFYEYDPATKKGYVYLPGYKEPWYSLNVGTCYRQVEGHWFSTWNGWESVARPLIDNAQAVAQASRF
jgi:hypothetical protein